MIGLLDQPVRLRRWTLIGYWTLMFLATHWPDIDDWAPHRLKLPNIDKVVHALMYGGWAVIWLWLLAGKRISISRATITWLFLGGITYAAFDEISQGWVERDPDVLDWTCDAIGILVAILILRVATRKPVAGSLR